MTIFDGVSEPRFYSLGSRRKLRNVKPVNWRTADRRYRQAVSFLDGRLGKQWVFDCSLRQISEARKKAELAKAIAGSADRELIQQFAGVTVVTPLPPATHEGFSLCRSTWRKLVSDLREERLKGRIGKVAASKKRRSSNRSGSRNTHLARRIV